MARRRNPRWRLGWRWWWTPPAAAVGQVAADRLVAVVGPEVVVDPPAARVGPEVVVDPPVATDGQVVVDRLVAPQLQARRLLQILTSSRSQRC